MPHFIDSAGVQVALAGAAGKDQRLSTTLQDIGFEPIAEEPTTPPAVVLAHFSDTCDCATAFRLALVAPNAPPAVLARFDDWVFLPVRAEELRMRIDQLLSRQADPELVADFTRLGLIGRDPVFLCALARLERYAASTLPVLICGDTGVGKERVARAIHYCGPQASGPFVPLNCGAMPDDLFTNEMFGHRAGAFTGGGAAAEGLIAQAEGGTLFLDEVDTLPPASQVALLRFLEDRSYRRLGGGQVRQSTARIIAATNCRIEDAVGSGCFRADLMFRLDVARIELPPLRERPADIALLARHFAECLAARASAPAKSLSPALIDWMRTQPWPGNIRELENFIAREVICTDGPVLGAPGEVRPEPKADQDRPCFRHAKALAVERFERDFLRDVLRRADGNVSAAARLSGKERRAFARLLKKHHLKGADFRDTADR